MSHPIREILVEAGYQITYAGDYWRTTAKFRGGKNPTSIAIDRRTGRWKDFTISGSPWQSPELLARTVKGEDVDFSGYEPTPEREKIRVTKVYPKEILKRLLPHFDFFKARGISVATLKEFEAGMAHSGKLNKRICFPIYDRHGRIIGFTGRWFKEIPFGDAPKWKHQSPKTEFLWPCHLNDALLREKKEVIILESPGDTLALWDAGIKNVICIFGVSISSKQLSYIIGLDPKKIIVATNNDEKTNNAGQIAAKKIYQKLSKHFDEAEIVISLPSVKDFGQMSSAEIKDWYEKTKIKD
jgi:5S rRNA maturation endonuclease (ribonuclease M5)